MRKYLILFLLAASPASAQIKTITGGGYQYPNGSPCASCTLTLQLTVDATVSGTGQIVPKLLSYTLDGSGNVPSGSTIWGNDQLTPNGTTYKASLAAVGGGQLWGPEYLSIAGTSPINLAQLIPVANPAVFFSNPAVTNLNNTFTGVNAFTGGLKSGQFNGAFYVDGTQYATLNAAFSACNVSPGCKLIIPPGSFSFSTQVAPTFIADIAGSGATYVNTQTNCTTTLTWTGGASAPFKFSGGAAYGSKLRDVCLNATGVAPPVFVDIDSGAGAVELDHVIVDTPTVAATVAAFRWGNTGAVVDDRCSSTFARDAAPISYDLLTITAKFTGFNCRAARTGSVVTNQWVIGSATQLAQDVVCHQCSSENINAAGNAGVLINNAIAFQWIGGYNEAGGNATSYAFDIPSSAILAQQITIIGGQCCASSGTGTSAFVHSNLASNNTAITVMGVRIGDSGMANPSYIIQDDAIGRGTVIGNNCSSTGCLPFKNGSGKIYAYGNTAVNLQPDTFPLSISFSGTTFAGLGTPANGNIIYCSDCTIANPCAGAGTGALAKRLNGVWVCN